MVQRCRERVGDAVSWNGGTSDGMGRHWVGKVGVRKVHGACENALGVRLRRGWKVRVVGGGIGLTGGVGGVSGGVSGRVRGCVAGRAGAVQGGPTGYAPRDVQVVVYVVRVSSNLTAVRERQRGRVV